MSRILWLSNAPWGGSGYAEQTALFVPKLQAMGHELAVAANYGLNGTRLERDGLLIYPADNTWGNRTLATYADDFRADQIIALCDAWVLNPDEWPEGLSAAVWAPVDHTPCPPAVARVLGNRRVRPVAMSRFGERMMRDAGLEPLYVPHGIDTKVFRPMPEIRDQVRDELGIPRDVFLAGMVAANVGNPMVPRKAFPQALTAFARFAERHQDAWLYCHTEGNPRHGSGGVNLYQLAERRGCPSDRVRLPADKSWHLGMPAQFVAFVYQALDVLLMPSMGEGFGIPLVEAQACGVPVIASDHSAMTENTYAGWLVSGDPWDDPTMEADFIVPSVASIIEALEAAYQARDDQTIRDAAAGFGAGFDADLVADRYWRPALADLAGRCQATEAMARCVAVDGHDGHHQWDDVQVLA